jgi:hypothetical protein
MMKLASGAAALLLAACATPPPGGPSVLVLPGTNKNFDQFRFDDKECRGYAHSSVDAKNAEQAATNTYGSIQQRYDHAFTQCMYAKGHRVPVSGRYSEEAGRPTQAAAARASPPPPPPPGQPPAEAPPDYQPKEN